MVNELHFHDQDDGLLASLVSRLKNTARMLRYSVSKHICHRPYDRSPCPAKIRVRTSKTQSATNYHIQRKKSDSCEIKDEAIIHVSDQHNSRQRRKSGQLAKRHRELTPFHFDYPWIRPNTDREQYPS